MRKATYLLISCLFFTILVSCAAAQDNSNSNNPDYEKTKKMTVDLLKTDEGKVAIQELMKEDEMRQALVMDHDFIKQTIQSTLTSETGKEFWQDLMKDPEFAKTFAESMQKENEKMLKALMKDPEYQTMMLTILKDPEMEKAVLDLMKSKEYRQQVMTIMEDSFESPLFTAKINEIFTAVAEKQMKKQEKENEESGGDNSGDEGGKKDTSSS